MNFIKIISILLTFDLELEFIKDVQMISTNVPMEFCQWSL